jgi:hypothetical protein
MPTITLGVDGTLMSINWNAQGDGDYLASVEAEAEGFKGHADGHVTRSDLKAFFEGLRKLEHTRKGKAVLISAAPDEFEVTVQAVDAVGHMAVIGTLRYTSLGGERPTQILRFEFDFEPNQLVEAVKATHAV